MGRLANLRRSRLALPAVAMVGVLGAVAVPAAGVTLARQHQPGPDTAVSSAAKGPAVPAASPTAPVAAAAAGFVTAAVVDSDATPGGGTDDADDKQKYTINVRLAKPSCDVYWNLDSSGEHSAGTRGWVEKATVPDPHGTGIVQATVGWRYNVNDHWALIASRRSATPYWGFIERSCLVDPPNRLLSGHAYGSGWSTVNFRPSAGTSAGSRHVTTNATVRTAPNGYVIGNLRAANDGDVFEWSHRCGNHGPWIFGWAPRAHTWGWILASDIGNPCAPADFPQAEGGKDGVSAIATAQPAKPSKPASGSPASPHHGASSAAKPAAAGPAATPAAQQPATSGGVAAPAPAAAPPVAAIPSPATQCYPQYTVTANANARATRAGAAIGSVAPGARVNVRENDGVWMYGYISQISGGAGAFGWLLDEKVDRTGTWCG